MLQTKIGMVLALIMTSVFDTQSITGALDVLWMRFSSEDAKLKVWKQSFIDD
jgi:hypothetical protein